jgi:DNA-binding MarR family transcriptional regulator
MAAAGDNPAQKRYHGGAGEPIDVEGYRRLLALRTDLRRFLRWSEERAREVGVTPAQHQLLLAVRGHESADGPTVGELADHLLLRHQSAVGLVDRAEAEGLVRRARDSSDHRLVRVLLTDRGEDLLAALSALHAEELRRLAGRMSELAAGL